MIKICSLEFLNKKYFQTDILNKNGKILYEAGDEITPSIILRLFFKDIYAMELPGDIDDESSELNIKAKAKFEATQKEKNKKEFAKIQLLEDAQIEKAKRTDETQKDKSENIAAEQHHMAQTSAPQAPVYLEFDKEEATQVSSYAKIMGSLLGLKAKELKELEVAAYFYNIGKSKIKVEDANNTNFKKMQAQAGYELLKKDAKFTERIADTARTYILNYDATTFALKNDEGHRSDIPFSHIVAIADYYYALEKKSVKKQEILSKMLQKGGNKFNIFILHKFINKMRDGE